jgi:hypothetical protein
VVEKLLTLSIADAIATCTALTEARQFEGNPFRLACRVHEPALPREIQAAWGDGPLPDGLVELWLATRNADLFVDVDYGQWGLLLLSPSDSSQRTRRERESRSDAVAPNDVVLGEFLGDQDLLLVDGHGRPMIATPLDDRPDWPRPADNIAEFLDRYVGLHGDKFWEVSDSEVG